MNQDGIPIEDRLRIRVDVFQPGGDTERLMLEAAEKIEELRDRLYRMTLDCDRYATALQNAKAST